MAFSMFVDFNNQRLLRFSELRVGLWAAAGGTALSISTEVSQVGLPEGVAVMVTGNVYLEPPHQLVGVLQAGLNDGPLVVPRPDHLAQVSWTVPLSYEALDALERARDGQELRLQLRVHVVLVGTDVEDLRWARSGNAPITVPAGQWVAAMEAAGVADAVYVVVRAPLHAHNGRRAEAVRFLREARRLLAEGHYPQAVAEARKMLDVLTEIALPPPTEEAKVRLRDKAQRWDALRKAVTELANAAPHGDEVTAEIDWTRQDAVTVIATIAGLLQRLPEDE
jgi:hypothetical protein